MNELSIFVDESGEYGEESKYYLLTLVLHDQSQSLKQQINTYENSLANRSYPNIPFHASPLMNGHGNYQNMDMADRKRLLSAFFIMVQRLPVRYQTFAYQKNSFVPNEKLSTRMNRDVGDFISDNLEYFQSFDKVKIYYDGGQQVISRVLHDAIELALSKDVALFRNAGPEDYRLAQVADFICAFELAAIKYEHHEETETDKKIYGSVGTFKRNYLKKIRRLRMP